MGVCFMKQDNRVKGKDLRFDISKPCPKLNLKSWLKISRFKLFERPALKDIMDKA